MTTVIRAVVDANVVVRATVQPTSEADAWTRRFGREVEAFAPDLFWPEVTNAFRGYVVAKLLTRPDAHEALAEIGRLPITLYATNELAPAALEVALDFELSGYDAYYLVLAEILEATLVTADRRLATAAPRAELIA